MIALLFLTLVPGSALAQTSPPTDLEDPEPIIQTDASDRSDQDIAARLSDIFAEFQTLSGVAIEVDDGVIRLSGEVANNEEADRAMRLAIRVEGAVTVQDEMVRTLAVSDNLEPIIDDARETLNRFYKALPLIGVAVAAFFGIALLGHILASMGWFWRLITPNPFLAELLAQAIRVIMLLVAIFTALSFLGATTLMTAILGGAGVIGLAVGFAVRDTLENYISSVMLSLRQPFRAGDHVIIDEREGIVSRLTTRATILVTLDGNHLRIPNSDVFKASILNYSTNPTRRLSFELGVDATDDPIAAIKDGVQALSGLEFVLTDPEPFGLIESVGDSSIILIFYAWLDQTQTNFGKGRSLAIRATKDILEANGFTLPEPIYRLRFDQAGAETSADNQSGGADERSRPSPAQRSDVDAEALDTRPDDVDAVRDAARNSEDGSAENLLDDKRPTE